MATKGKGKTESFIKKFKTEATVVFTQVSKHYLTCETSTESTNRPRQITNKKTAVHRKWLSPFFILLIWNPRLQLFYLYVSWQSQGQACSPPPHLSLVLVLQENYGDEQRHGPPVMSDNAHVNALFNDVTTLYTAPEHYEKHSAYNAQNVTVK